MLNSAQIEQIFSPGNMVQIEFRDREHTKRIYKTMILKATEDLILLQLPEDQTAVIEAGTKLAVICNHVDSQHHFFTAEVIAYHEGSPPDLVITIPAPVKTFARRRFFRCDVELKFEYKYQESTEQKGHVINLSASGLMAVIPYNPLLKPGMHLECKIWLPSNGKDGDEEKEEELSFEANIVRIDKFESKSERGLALDFKNVSEQFQNRITKYLFKRQRELIKSGRIKVGRI